MKSLCAIMAIVWMANCTSFQDKTQDIIVSKDDPILDIKYDNSDSQSSINFEQDDDKKTITLKNKNKTWKITYKDFKILTLGYKNWRVVEDVRPEISKITEDSNWINFTFNYYKTIESADGTSARISILSGTVSLSKKVVRTKDEENRNKNLKWWIVGLGSYSTVITIILFAVIL